ncbi:MAG: hypothetical protein PHC99_07410 [Methylococcales bacterium]|nr:hypothetical protein [Methylococcales bacterium]
MFKTCIYTQINFMEYDKTKIENNSKIIRSMIEHENSLVAQRVSWMTTIQGLLFTALAFAWKENSAHNLILPLCVFGSIVASVTIKNLMSSIDAITRLVCWYQEHNDKTVIAQLPPVIGLDIYPSVDGYCKYIKTPPILLACTFLFGWFLFGWVFFYLVSPS